LINGYFLDLFVYAIECAVKVGEGVIRSRENCAK